MSLTLKPYIKLKIRMFFDGSSKTKLALYDGSAGNLFLLNIGIFRSGVIKSLSYRYEMTNLKELNTLKYL